MCVQDTAVHFSSSFNPRATGSTGFISLQVVPGPVHPRELFDSVSHATRHLIRYKKCGTALGATFDTKLIRRVGVFLAKEAKLKSAVVLLAPTINIQRSPLGGRSFESFSEDPSLSGANSKLYLQCLSYVLYCDVLFRNSRFCVRQRRSNSRGSLHDQTFRLQRAGA